MNITSHPVRIMLSFSLLLLITGITSADQPSTEKRDVITQVDWVSLLPAPPAANSVAQMNDVKAVRDMQRRFPSVSARTQVALADEEPSCFRFADVLGSNFNAAKLPLTAAFLNDATQQSSKASGIAKHYWMRPRPYVIDKHIAARGYNNEVHRKERGEAVQRDIDYTSYPSGHATFGTMCALMLNRLVPEKKVELFARAETYRESRMVLGVHFRTDLEAGRLLATSVAAVISLNPAFQQEEQLARNELRAALGLSVNPTTP